MKTARVLALALLLTVLAACGGPTEPEQNAAPETPAVTDSGATQSDESVREVEVVEESSGEAPMSEKTEATDKIVLAETDSQGPKAPPTSDRFQPQTHYQRLTTSQGTSSPPDVVEVAEVFWYGCSHCFNFDPVVKSWAKNLPEDVNFIRIPVMWNPTNAVHARLFYTLEALGKLDEAHDEVFTEIHLNRNMLTSEAEMIEFAERFGISSDEFMKTFQSFAVESKLKRAQNLTKRYRIQSVPIMVVNGTYLTSGKGIKNFNDMLAVTDELVASELQNR